MKRYINKKHAVVVTLLAGAVVAFSQGTFQNLDFEDANLSSYQPLTFVPTTVAFPSWQVSEEGPGGTSQLSSVAYDGLSLGGAYVSIFGNNPPYGPSPLDGDYSALLFGGGPGGVNLYSVSLSQTGGVPSGAGSIQLEANDFGSPFVVTLGGVTIDMVPLQSFAHYELWGGNVPASMAGQSETLTITEPPLPASADAEPSTLELDGISFSPTTVIPEADSLVLMGIGGALFAAYRRPRAKALMKLRHRLFL